MNYSWQHERRGACLFMQYCAFKGPGNKQALFAGKVAFFLAKLITPAVSNDFLSPLF